MWNVYACQRLFPPIELIGTHIYLTEAMPSFILAMILAFLVFGRDN